VFEGNLKSILSNLEKMAGSKTVLGKPVTVGSITLVPVISLKVGLGSGHSESIRTGGGGGGVNIEPRAVIVIQEGKVSIYSLHQKDTLSELAEAVPELSRLWEQDCSGQEKDGIINIWKKHYDGCGG